MKAEKTQKETFSRIIQVRNNNKGRGVNFTDNRSQFIQRTPAYRVDRNIDHPKVLLSENQKKVTGFIGDTGIDISFESDTHANTYFEHHGGRLVGWEFNSDEYEEIKKKVGKKKSKYDTLPPLSNCSDPWVRKIKDEKIMAPHFPTAWLSILNKIGKGDVLRLEYEKVFVYFDYMDEYYYPMEKRLYEEKYSKTGEIVGPIFIKNNNLREGDIEDLEE